MSSDEQKDKVINDIYFEESGFGSIKTTYADARLKDKRITLKYVQEWFSKNVGNNKQPGGTNSFVAQAAFDEYQIDLFFINDLEKQKFKVGLVCIDIFSKFAAVIPIKSKDTGDVAAGVIEAIVKMGRKPKMIYTDDEAAQSTTALKTYFEEEKIKHYITRKHAAFAERFIRTFKGMLYKRIDSTKNKKTETDPQWIDYVYQVMLTYNNKSVHSSTRKIPADAMKDTHQVDVKANLEIRAMKNRKYPHLMLTIR